MAVDFNGARGARCGVTKNRMWLSTSLVLEVPIVVLPRIRSLQKEVLPHVGASDFCEMKKAYFLGCDLL